MTMIVQAYVIVGAVGPAATLPSIFVGVSVIRRIIPQDPGNYGLAATLVQPSDSTSAGLQGLNLDLAKNSQGQPLIFLDETSATTWLSTAGSGDDWRRAISAHAIVNLTVTLP